MESKIQKKIMDYLEALGFYVIKTIRTNRAGVPDIIACAPDGSFVAIEVKAAGKKNTLTKLQDFHIKLINTIGGVAIVADCLEDVTYERITQMIQKKKEEHITVLPETFEKLKEICAHEKRTYRAEVTKMIDEKHEAIIKKGK